MHQVVALSPGQLTLAEFSSLQTDRFGLSGATATWNFVAPGTMEAQWATLRSLLPEIYSTHPVFTFLGMERRNVRWDGNRGFWSIEGEFFGIDGSETDSIYDLDLDGNVEPIETHPDFTAFAVSGNGAVFESDGAFKGFLDKTKPAWYGVTSYIRPGAIWTRSYYSTLRPNDVSDVGTINNPEGFDPAIANSQNWLYLGLQFQQRGSAYFIRKTWKASGPLGWNSTIY